MKSVDLTDKGNEWLAQQVDDPQLFVLPDIAAVMSQIEASDLPEEEKIAQKDKVYNDYAIKSERVHTIQQLLKAYTMFNLNDEYVIQDGEVKIVDEQTGRIMEGRRWSDGLHQAVEAKEHVKVQDATQTYATITLQNYFRMYHKLSGMTGTAVTEAGEFWDIYKLDVVEVPTNRPVIRKDMNDRVYRTQRDVHRVFRDELRLGGHYRPSGAALRQLIAGTFLHVGVVDPRDHKCFHKALDKCGLPGTYRPHNTKHESAVGTRRYIAVDICISHNKASALMFSFVRVYEQRRQFMTSVAGYRVTACYMKSII